MGRRSASDLARVQNFHKKKGAHPQELNLNGKYTRDYIDTAGALEDPVQVDEARVFIEVDPVADIFMEVPEDDGHLGPCCRCYYSDCYSYK